MPQWEEIRVLLFVQRSSKIITPRGWRATQVDAPPSPASAPGRPGVKSVNGTTTCGGPPRRSRPGGDQENPDGLLRRLPVAYPGADHLPTSAADIFSAVTAITPGLIFPPPTVRPSGLPTAEHGPLRGL